MPLILNFHKTDKERWGRFPFAQRQLVANDLTVSNLK